MVSLLDRVKTALKGTVIKRIWFKMILVAIYTVAVVGIYTSVPEFSAMSLKIDLTDILGVVTGLLLVFRTQIAYDRYWEGRNLWTSLGSTVGTLARLIWISIKDTDTQDLVEKKTMMNLLSAFPLATKHYLRNEYSQDFEDMREFLSAFPETLMKPPTNRNKAIMANGNPGGKTDEVPDFVAQSNAPGEITYYLGTYLDKISERDIVDTHVMKILQDSVSALGDYLCSFEKILRTPMPLAYSRHLEHCLHIYILALPFQLVHDLMWITVPVVVVACFAILGILGIGEEIENPFGYDDNDLALDDFCTDIIKEIRLITSLQLPVMTQWTITTANQPCGPTGLNAEEIVNTKTVEEAREIFRQHARLDPPPLSNIKRTSMTTMNMSQPMPLGGNDNPMMAGKSLSNADAEP